MRKSRHLLPENRKCLSESATDCVSSACALKGATNKDKVSGAAERKSVSQGAVMQPNRAEDLRKAVIWAEILGSATRSKKPLPEITDEPPEHTASAVFLFFNGHVRLGARFVS